MDSIKKVLLDKAAKLKITKKEQPKNNDERLDRIERLLGLK